MDLAADTEAVEYFQEMRDEKEEITQVLSQAANEPTNEAIKKILFLPRLLTRRGLM